LRGLLLQLDGTMWLVASLLYGTGMRILEGLRLRIKDVEFERREMLNKGRTRRAQPVRCFVREKCLKRPSRRRKRLPDR
jgi:integrase